ncbi:MAG: NAD(P)-dependent oxidoreductase, partial [Actinobacteria bacterium]
MRVHEHVGINEAARDHGRPLATAASNPWAARPTALQRDRRTGCPPARVPPGPHDPRMRQAHLVRSPTATLPAPRSTARVCARDPRRCISACGPCVTRCTTSLPGIEIRTYSECVTTMCNVPCSSSLHELRCEGQDVAAYLIAGAGGMLGTALRGVIAERGEHLVAPSETAFDVTDADAVASVVADFVAGLEPGERGVLINAAAYTNVERAEDEPELAYRVNEHGAGALAAAARDMGLGFIHVSTDFVFDGDKAGAYTEDDAVHPLSVYGASKLAGERAVDAAHRDALTVRTAWVFGAAGANFPLKVLSAARERGALSVVTDEIGSPTYTVDLARGILGL